MENEMMNNMDAMTENLTDAMPEVDNLVPSVDENHAEMSSASGSFGKTAVFMLAGAAAYKGAVLQGKELDRQQEGEGRAHRSRSDRSGGNRRRIICWTTVTEPWRNLRLLLFL